MYETIVKKFGRLGVRARIHPPRIEWFWMRQSDPPPIRLDVSRDRQGEFFDVGVDAARVGLLVLDVQPAKRHLLLMARRFESGAKEKFLCGHDERAWFVAAVPDGPVSSVRTAMEALKPGEVLLEQGRHGVRFGHRQRRRTAAFVRQGEWFFVPAPELVVDEFRVLRNEPIRRSNGKPHIVEYLFRNEGQTVYVCPRYPSGLVEVEYRRVLTANPDARYWAWQVLRRDSVVHARGSVRHRDHAAIWLNGWHRVLLNTESRAPSMRHVAFLD